MRDKLFYTDFISLDVHEVPYTRDRAMSVAPIFHSTRDKALQALRPAVEENAQKALERMYQLWAELGDETDEGIPPEDVKLLKKYGDAGIIENLKRLQLAEMVIDEALELRGDRMTTAWRMARRYREVHPVIPDEPPEKLGAHA